MKISRAQAGTHFSADSKRRGALLCSTALAGLVAVLPGADPAKAQVVIQGATVVTVPSPDQPSPWNVGDELWVGDSTNGTLYIRDGGHVTSTGGAIGVGGTANGGVEVSGTDGTGGQFSSSSWRISGTLSVEGTGGIGGSSLGIYDGGFVQDTLGIVGSNSNSGNAYVTVQTNDSAQSGFSVWQNTGNLIIGYYGSSGVLNVLSGGRVSSKDGYVGYAADADGKPSTGEVLVNGTDALGYNSSNWTSSGVLHVGDGATGTLTIANLGVVDAASVEVGEYGGAGTIVIGGIQPNAGVQAPGILASYTYGDPLPIHLWQTGALEFNHTGTGTSYDFDLQLTGNGAVRQKAGVTVLSGDSSAFAGHTDVTGGTLTVNGTLGAAGSTVSVASGGALGGKGGIGGDVTVASGGTLEGVQGQTLTMNSLALDPGADVDVALGAPGNAAGLFNVANDLVLNGTLNVADAGGFGNGLYRLFDYGGALNGAGLTVGTTPAGYAAGDMAVQTAVAHQVNLLVDSSGSPPSTAFNFWNGAPTGSVSGGSGTWSAAGANWTNADGSGSGTYDPAALLIFSGTGGTVTVDAGGAGSLPLGEGMQFASDGYVIGGDGLAMGSGTTTIRVGDGTAAGAGYTAIIAANLTGEGNLDKTDLGTLVLTGENSYTGGTTIANGILQIGTGGKTGAIAGDVAIGGATLAFDRSNDFSFGGDISGTGTLRQIGSGKTELTGDSSGFDGVISVENGILAVNGKLGGSLNIEPHARVQGTGTVGDLIAEPGGTVAPGNSIGTLNVAGDVGFSAGSTYQVEVNAAGQSDLIAASGAAGIKGGAVDVLAGSGNYAPSIRYTILTAEGGVNGTFDSVSSDFAFLAPTLTYDADNVYLEIDRNGIDFDSIGGTPNERAAARGVESLDPHSAIYGAVLPLDIPSARAAFDQLSGEIHASAQSVLIEDSRFVREAVNDRIRSAFGDRSAPSVPVMAYGETGTDGGATAAIGHALTPTDGERLAAWGSIFGSWGSFNGDGNVAGLDHSVGGFLTGIDGMVAENMRLGIMTGYSHDSFQADARGSSGESDNYHLGIYGGGQWRALGLRAGAAYTWHDISTGRSVAFPGFADSLDGDYRAGTFQMFGEAGYRVDTATASFEPFANLAYVSLHTDGFTEKGGAAALHGDSQTTDATFATLGVHASTGFDLGGIRAAARGTLGWRHAFGDTTPDSILSFAGGSPFSIAGVPIARDAAVIEAELDFSVFRRAALGLSYNGQFGSGATDQSVKANFSIRF
jgi:outer membrane autotransporter protein